jgi:Phosphatidylinositol-4-phosphate 5-kinase
MIDLLIQAVIYATTAIATLRAGSRALYAFHHAEIGVIDGPLILSPQDVHVRKNQGGDEVEVSPLWEYAFGFSEAVRLLHDEDKLPVGEIQQGSWKEDEEASHYYSMSWPHKTLQQIQSSKGMNNKEDSHSVDSLHKNTPETEKEGSLVAVRLGEMKRWREHGFLQAMKRYMTAHTHDILHLYETFKDLCHEIWNCHPLFGSQNIFSRKEPSHFHEGDVHTAFEDEHLNFDIFYSTTITLPTSPTNVTLDDIAHPSNQRMVQLKSFAPKVFARLRSRFEVHEEAFLSSILKSGPFVSFQSNSKGALRVGGFFFFSRDGAYMIKTIKVRK